MTKNADNLYMPGEAYKGYGIQLTEGGILKREDAGASFAKRGIIQRSGKFRIFI